MNFIQLLTLIILLNSTHVSSTKCRNPNVTCLELCCGMNQFYEDDTKWCKDLPESAQPMWLALIENYMKTTKVDFVEFGECSLSPKQSVIEECYGPEYNYTAENIDLMMYSNVPCDRLKPDVDDPYLLVLGTILLDLSPICLPIMLLLLCIKKDKKNKLSYKLIIWYLTMTIATLLSMRLGNYIEGKIKSQDSPLIYWNLLPQFSWSSAELWLICIGYNVYMQFKEVNDPHRERNDRMHFIWYSIFVWAGALTLEMLQHWTKLPLKVVIPPFNVLAFLVLSFKISLIRCRVIGISTEKHIKCKLALIIFRLFILMGMPRMLLTILPPVTGFDNSVAIFSLLEPYMVYGAFILQNEIFSTFFRCKSCCAARQNEENERTPEDIRMRNTCAV